MAKMTGPNNAVMYNLETHTHTHIHHGGFQQAVVVVGSHIQRLGCQPVTTTFHGGQSRSWSAEHGKENKKRKSGSTPPPPPCCSDGGKKTHGAYTEENKKADGQEGHHVTHLHACVPKCYAGFGPFRVPTGFRRLVNEAVKFIGTQLRDLTNSGLAR